MLHEFIALNRDEIISRCRAKVVSRSVPPPTDAASDHGVPVFLDQLVDALRAPGGHLISSDAPEERAQSRFTDVATPDGQHAGHHAGAAIALFQRIG